MKQYDYLIIGAGIIGLSIARELKLRYPRATIALIEKENQVAYHASGRNSGVLHAGFYYHPTSLKAKFTAEGNREMQAFCEEYGLPILKCGKVVVATNQAENDRLDELYQRGIENGVKLEWLDERTLNELEPMARTHQRALYSPSTASIDPVQVCQTIYQNLQQQGVELLIGQHVRFQANNQVVCDAGTIQYDYLINASGLYADQIASNFGFSKRYKIVPFKGFYLDATTELQAMRTHIYPVPDLRNPFLGVHFTRTLQGKVKIGPTATPAFWRENYVGMERFNFQELADISFRLMKMWKLDIHSFRALAVQEWRKADPTYMTKLAEQLINVPIQQSTFKKLKPGIRAQLIDLETMWLVSDFLFEGDHRSFHVLNAVSPGFTSAFPFSKYLVDQIEKFRNLKG